MEKRENEFSLHAKTLQIKFSFSESKLVSIQRINLIQLTKDYRFKRLKIVWCGIVFLKQQQKLW